MNVANAAFTTPGYPFVPAYLDIVGTTYGSVIEELDFTDVESAAARINDFVAVETEDPITEVVAPDDVDPRTTLALVNATLLLASWQADFDAALTDDDGVFTLLDGAEVTVPLMAGAGGRSGRGEGWVGATKYLVGNIVFDVVVPDEGRFDEVADRVDVALHHWQRARTRAVPLRVAPIRDPRHDSARRSAPTLGLTAPLRPGSLLGVADDPLLAITAVQHQAFLAIDEDGIEAAAATVVFEVPVSEPVEQPIPVVVDRPFLSRISDSVTGATLFSGRIMDPTP